MLNSFVLFYCHLDRWVPECAGLFVANKLCWCHLVPKSEHESNAVVRQFFGSVHQLMSLHLRQLVYNSLADLVDFFLIHAVSAIDDL